MRTPETKIIGQYTYTVAMLPPRDAHRLLMRAIRVAGPGLAPVLTAAGGSLRGAVEAIRAAGQAVDAVAVGGAFTKALSDDASWLDTAVQRLVGALDEKELDIIIDTLSSVTTVARAQVPLGMLTNNMDLVFGDDLRDLYAWLWFAWKVQFSSFFGSLVRVPAT